jgi:DNA-directed RNA polymerase I and III subunit RPAC1
MAIEHIYIKQNTSIIQEEVLSHRLGLIPIKADPRNFEYRTGPNKATDSDTIVFSLNVSCTKNPDCNNENATPKEKYINESGIFFPFF